MEYLVTMTTRVPEGTSVGDVDAVRAREAAHTRELAAQGRVVRLWRPPLGPGEWRTIGLFTADGPEDLEQTLASMPLRVWRTDEPMALGAHANDPGPGTVPLAPDDGEYLVTFIVRIPTGTDSQTIEKMTAGEASAARQAAEEGRLVRLWALTGRQGRNISLWQAPTAESLHTMLDSLPMTEAGWLAIQVMPLTRHPSDPATSASSAPSAPSAPSDHGDARLQS